MVDKTSHTKKKSTGSNMKTTQVKTMEQGPLGAMGYNGRSISRERTSSETPLVSSQLGNTWQTIVKKLYFKINYRLNAISSFLYHSVTFNIQDVKHTDLPFVNGKVIIKNEGACRFGKQLKFNSRVRSNYVGLAKPCTISVRPGAVLEIDDYSGFSGVSIVCSSRIKIGKYVNCGGNVSIWDTDFHPINYLDRRVHDYAKINSAPVEIGDDVFIGANAMVLKGVSIGARSVIGAGSVVTKNIPPNQIWAGNPARFIKALTD